MEDELIVGTAQFGGTPYWEENLETCLDIVDVGVKRGIDLLVFPEGSLRTTNGDQTDQASKAQPLDGPFIAGLVSQSKTNDVCVVIGTTEATSDRRPSNTLVAIRRGEIIATYRKLHLYDAFSAKESDSICPGEEELGVFDLGGFSIGMMTCYDVRFPEVARLLAVAGADVIAIPAAWVPGPLKEMHWQVMCTARALENTCFVVATGKAAPTRVGLSMIIDPLGVPLAQLGHEDGMAVATLSRSSLKSVRQRLPLLQQRRFRVNPEPVPFSELPMKRVLENI